MPRTVPHAEMSDFACWLAVISFAALALRIFFLLRELDDLKGRR